MQRMFNLDKWTEIADGNGLHFVNPRPRKVSIEVNSPHRAALSIMDHAGEVHFLALVEGRDTVEFNSLGEFSLLSDTEGVMIYTADGADISSQVVAPVIFTKIMNRRARNPELENFMRQMETNLERRLTETAIAFERRLGTPPSAVQSQPPAIVPSGAVPPEPKPPANAGNDSGAGDGDGAGGATGSPA